MNSPRSTLKALTGRHPRAWLALVIIVPLLFAVLTTVKANGAEAPAQTQSQTPISNRCPVTNGDGGCWFGPKVSAKRFRHGYFHRTHGIPVRHVFKAPKVAKRIFVRKITRKIGHLSARHRARIVAHFGSSRGGIGTACTDNCLAWKMYGELASTAGCVGAHSPLSTAGTCRSGTNAGVTKDQVQKGGAVVICGAFVVIGVLSAPETAGGGTVAMTALAGTFSCGWSAWMMFD